MDKTDKQGIEFLEAGKKVSETFESAEQVFDLIALAVDGLVISPTGQGGCAWVG